MSAGGGTDFGRLRRMFYVCSSAGLGAYIVILIIDFIFF
jgi:hypothetical protein